MIKYPFLILINFMKVIKRNGTSEEMKFDKVTQRISQMCKGLSDIIDPQKLAMNVIDGLYDGVSTSEIDTQIAETAAVKVVVHPDFSQLAANVSISNLHKNTKQTFSTVMKDLYNYVNPKNKKHSPIVSKELMDVIKKNSAAINARVVNNRDYNYDYFGFKTLEKSYLKRINGEVVERPQHMLMRVSLGIHGEDLENAFITYDMMSNKMFTHATPTLFNSGTPRPQMSSCFLVDSKEDSIDGIYDTLKICAKISKDAGGIGLNTHGIRATGSYIAGTNGTSNGIVPMLKVFNETARYVDQCFTGETLIYTKNGVKEMSTISRGDEVLTDDGNWYMVNEKRVYQKDSSEILSIKVNGNPIKVTDIHPLLGIKVGDNSIPSREIKRLESGLNSIEYFEASEFDKGDYLGRAIPNGVKDIETLSLEDMRIYGILLGDGSISKSRNECNIYLGTEEKSETIDFVNKYLSERQIKFTKKLNEDGSVNIFYIYLPTNSSFKFSLNDVYDSNYEKSINHNFLNLPHEKSMAILKGLVETDGSVKDDRIMFYTSSKPLLDGIEYILLRMGLPLYYTERDRIEESKDREIKHTKLNYDCEIPKTAEMSKFFGVSSSKFFKFIVHNNILLSKIKEISYLESGSVYETYDLCVDNNHTYTTSVSTNTNGGGKRKGSFAVYLETWHADIFEFLDLKKNHGKEEMRARDLFYAMWTSDLFMERVRDDKYWCLMTPSDSKGLQDVYGDEFKELYERYESEGNYVKKIKARELWDKIMVSQIETGTPYMLYKDAANVKSNQKNLGTIKSSNLCAEIVEYTSPDEVAVCNLASIALPAFVKEDEKGVKYLDHKELYKVSYQATFNLNRVIDRNYYPVEEARNSNMKHRPIGLGVQGLADVFMLMRLPFTSDEAKKLNKDIHETIYFASMTASNDIAIKEGAYETFKGSPFSEGVFQFEMWGLKDEDLSGLWDWKSLRKSVIEHGVRNSLLTAFMPTASTGQILGNNECFEAITSNIYTRRVLSGEFVVINKHLIKDLVELGLWNSDMKDYLMYKNGSVQELPIPKDLKDLYKTVFEMSQKDIIDMSADRGAFVDQSQSLNLFSDNITSNILTSMHFYGWNKGLKTGMYYLRTKSASNAKQVTLDVNIKDRLETANHNYVNNIVEEVGSMSAESFKAMIDRSRAASENDEDCLMCGS